jgi:predicted N-acetyltransferase YhbS
MSLELVPSKPEHVPELGRICYEAFKDISDRHGFPADFDSGGMARMVIGMLVQSKNHYSVTAMLDGQPVGSNFLLVSDEVSSVGPITIEVPCQGQGVGRALMEDVIAQARKSNFESIRLLQDSFNMGSLALYASLGFDTKEPCTLMRPAAGPSPDDTIRPVSHDDLPVVEHLSRQVYKVSRRNEVASLLGGPFRPFLRERGGRVVGYFILGMPGHGVAETEDDAVALVGEAARQTPAQFAAFFCPLTEGSLYRKLLAAGCRNIKVMNLMTIGSYERPDGVWMPSVGY